MLPPISAGLTSTAQLSQATAANSRPAPGKDATQEAFQAFVGETFYGMMLKALRSTSGETAYLNGGQAEEMFRNQMDQHVAERLSETHGEQLSKQLYDRFRKDLPRIDVTV